MNRAGPRRELRQLDGAEWIPRPAARVELEFVATDRRPDHVEGVDAVRGLGDPELASLVTRGSVVGPWDLLVHCLRQWRHPEPTPAGIGQDQLAHVC